MCGIAGIWDPLGRVPVPHEAILSVALRMADGLRHRGPDEDGIWESAAERLVFAHRRLSIVDLSPTGSQPMTSGEGRHCITFNGEIYNHRELRRRLSASGTTFRGTSDTEVLLEAIVAWGLTDALSQSCGMFAFALWDASQQSLTLARDRLGEKPIYYSLDRGIVHFASELGALMLSPWVCQTLDQEAISDVLGYGYVRHPRSILRQVAQLPPACVLEIKREGLARWQDAHRLPGQHGSQYPQPRNYWSFADVTQSGSPRSYLESTAAVHEALKLAIAEQLEADVPVGTLLSGGVDSTLVTAVASRVKPSIKAFTVGFEDSSYDESDHARRIAEHLGATHCCIRVAEKDLLFALEEVLGSLDEPFANPSQLPLLLLSKRACEEVKVVLGGDGGDEFFLGYSRYQIWKMLPHVEWLPRWVRQAARGAFSGRSARVVDHVYGKATELAPSLFPPIQSPGTKLEKFFATVHGLDHDSINEDLLRTNLPAMAFPRPLSQGWQMSQQSSILPTMPAVTRYSRYDQMAYLVDDGMTKVDRATMRASLECREPLLDIRVVNEALRTPLSDGLLGHGPKGILRNLVGQYVPAGLFDRPKMGFSVPISSWLRGPLRDALYDALDRSIWADVEGVDDSELRRAADLHCAGRRDYGRGLWSAVVVGRWLANSASVRQSDSDATIQSQGMGMFR